tara:strand:- start:1542 stop:2063 length:522 start_codon:yes stop_codon:yes gene_type:complete
MSSKIDSKIEILPTLTGFRVNIYETEHRVKCVTSEHFPVFIGGESYCKNVDQAYRNAVNWANVKIKSINARKIVLTPRGYYFELIPTVKELRIFDKAGFRVYDSIADFIKFEREYIENVLGLDSKKDDISPLYICDNREGWRCDRGILYRFDNPCKITDPEMLLFFFLLNFEL